MLLRVFLWVPSALVLGCLFVIASNADAQRMGIAGGSGDCQEKTACPCAGTERCAEPSAGETYCIERGHRVFCALEGIAGCGPGTVPLDAAGVGGNPFTACVPPDATFCDEGTISWVRIVACLTTPSSLASHELASDEWDEGDCDRDDVPNIDDTTVCGEAKIPPIEEDSGPDPYDAGTVDSGRDAGASQIDARVPGAGVEFRGGGGCAAANGAQPAALLGLSLLGLVILRRRRG